MIFPPALPMTRPLSKPCLRSVTSSTATGAPVAELRQRGLIANHKKLRRLMRQHDLQPKSRRRFTVTTDSRHDEPDFPNLAAGMVPAGPNQLWVSDIAYVALPRRFVYAAIVLDAWSRRVIGYAIGPYIDAGQTLAALNSAIASRNPPRGCVHHSDRGSQYAAERYRRCLSEHGLSGSMGRKGNPYDNAKAESFMKTLKTEAVYPMDFKTFDDVIQTIPHFIEDVYNKRRLHSALAYLSPMQFEKQHASQGGGQSSP